MSTLRTRVPLELLVKIISFNLDAVVEGCRILLLANCSRIDILVDPTICAHRAPQYVNKLLIASPALEAEVLSSTFLLYLTPHQPSTLQITAHLILLIESSSATQKSDIAGSSIFSF